jgi:peptidoglycan/LPS O-acetylase OafA/YrhL
LALLGRDPLWRGRLDRLVSGARPLLLLAMLLLSIALGLVSAKFEVGMAYTLNALLLTALTWAAIRRADSRFGRLLNHRVAAAVGVGSYSLYLWQQIFLDRTKDSPLTRFPQNLLLACAAALLSYHLVEKPFLGLKERLGQRAASPAVGSFCAEEEERQAVSG